MLPYSGRILPEFGREDLREVPVRPYRIIYRILSDADRMTLFGSETRETKARIIGLRLRITLQKSVPDFKGMMSAQASTPMLAMCASTNRPARFTAAILLNSVSPRTSAVA